MKKRIISFFTSLLMVFSVISVLPSDIQAAAVSEETFASKIAELKTIYRDGEYWNFYNGIDGTGLKKCYCTNSCAGECSCECGKFYYNGSKVGGQCYGFANKMAYLIFGTVPELHWTKSTSVSNYYAGDYVRVRNNAHSIFITKVEGNTITYVDCNNAGPCMVKWDRTITVSSLKSMTTYVRHLDGNNLNGTGIPDNNNDDIIDVIWTQDTSYPTPISAYPAATSGKINVYNANLTAYAQSERHIAFNDLCTINTVYKNGYCNVTYPTASGTNTEYAKLSDFIPNAVTKYSYSPTSNMTSYTRVDLSTTFGSVFTTDKCTVVGKSGSKLQLIYPVKDGYKLGWINAETIAPSQLQTPLYGYNASPTVRTTVFESLATMGTYYGQIFVDDKCTLNSVNFNDNWINVTYPANSSTKTGYVYLTDFIPADSRISNFYKTTVTAESTSYRKSDMSVSFGYASAGDEITVIGKSGNKLQVVYPLDAGGYKLAWIYDTYVKKELSKISIVSNPTKVSYLEGESLNTSGLSVIATYNDGSTADITSSCTFSGYSNTPGVKTVNVSYSGKSTAFTVTVSHKTLTSLTLTSAPTKKSYFIGDSVSLAGMSVKAGFNNGTTAIVNGYNTSIDSSTTASVGTKTITIYYDHNNIEKSVSFDITVNKPSISLSKTSLSMKKGEIATITASMNPASQTVNWSSSDSSVVSVKDGKLTASAGGKATISASYIYNGIKYEAKADVSILAETTSTTTKATITTTSITKAATKPATTTVTKVTTTFVTTTITTITSETTTTTIVSYDTDALIRVIGESGSLGDKVYADIYVTDNPGVAAMCLDISYDKTKLRLLNVTDGKILGDSVATFGNDLSANPYRLCWDDSGDVNNDGNGILATLEFEILENAKAEETEVYVALQQSSTFDKDLNDVVFNTQHGIIFIEEKQVTTTPQVTTTVETTASTTATTVKHDTDALIRVIGESGQPGDKVYADIYVTDNPGVAAMCLDVSYDKSKLKLLSVTDGKILGESVATFGNDLSANPYRLCWDDSGDVNNNGNGILATLEFEILENVKAEETEVYVTVQQSSTFDKYLNDVEFNTQHGIIFIEEKQVTTTPQVTTATSETTTTTTTVTTTSETTTTTTTTMTITSETTATTITTTETTMSKITTTTTTTVMTMSETTTITTTTVTTTSETTTTTTTTITTTSETTTTTTTVTTTSETITTTTTTMTTTSETTTITTTTVMTTSETTTITTTTITTTTITTTSETTATTITTTETTTSETTTSEITGEVTTTEPVSPTLSKTGVDMSCGDKVLLKVENYTGEVKWISSDITIASVDNHGQVTALKEGTAFIMAFIEDIYLTCTVNISAGVDITLLLGDANLDGKLNVRDCATIAGALAKGEGDNLPVNADFNEDGKTNVRDAAAIANWLAMSYMEK